SCVSSSSFKLTVTSFAPFSYAFSVTRRMSGSASAEALMLTRWSFCTFSPTSTRSEAYFSNLDMNKSPFLKLIFSFWTIHQESLSVPSGCPHSVPAAFYDNLQALLFDCHQYLQS